MPRLSPPSRALVLAALTLLASTAHAQARPVAGPGSAERVSTWIAHALAGTPCAVGDVSAQPDVINVVILCNGAPLGALHVSHVAYAPDRPHIASFTLLPDWATASDAPLPWHPFLARLDPPPTDVWHDFQPPPPPTPHPPQPRPVRPPPPPDPGQRHAFWFLPLGLLALAAALYRRPALRALGVRLALVLVAAAALDALLGLWLARTGTLPPRNLADWRLAQPLVNDVFLPAEPPLPPAPPPPFVLGILGGSVAVQVGESLAVHPEEFPALEELARVVGRPVHVLPLGLTGGAQPAQFNILNLFGQRLDAIAVLDGFNELFVLSAPQHRTCAQLEPLWAQPGADPQRLLAPIRAIHHAAVQDLERSRWLPLPWSALGQAWLQRRQVAWKNAVNAQYAWPFAQPAGPELDVPPQERVARWAACVDAMQRQAQRKGVPATFFIQPNQYVAGSKPLSAEETARQASRLQRSQPDVAVYRGLTGLYRDLSAAGAGLRDRGIPVHDLVDLFHDTTATVYRDDCCHFNELGIQMLARAVLQQVAKDVAPRR